MSIRVASHLYRNRHGVINFRFVVLDANQHIAGTTSARVGFR